jgi:ADP-ribose pyrophosphatase YjhB (NUDIX family)
MDTLIPGIRNAVRAVIVRGDSLLVQQKLYEDGSERLTLPGGAPDLGETLEAALRRECAEELGAQIRVFELLHVADYFKPRDSDPPTRRQQVEFLFRCEVPDSYEAQNGLKPDKHQVDVRWLSFRDVTQSQLFPPSLKDILTVGRSRSGVYLGLID